MSDGLQVLIDDADWSAANPQLYGRLIDRMGMSRTDEISKRTGEVGPMQANELVQGQIAWIYSAGQGTEIQGQKYMDLSNTRTSC